MREKATQQAAKKPKRNPAPSKPAKQDIFCKVIKSTLQIDLVMEFEFHPVRKWRFDYAIPELKIAIENEGGVWSGGRHTRPAGFLNDISKYNEAALLGWRVFRVTPDTLLKTATIEMIKEATNPIKRFE